jgi:hypothetical protein
MRWLARELGARASSKLSWPPAPLSRCAPAVKELHPAYPIVGTRSRAAATGRMTDRHAGCRPYPHLAGNRSIRISLANRHGLIEAGAAQRDDDALRVHPNDRVWS